MAFNSVVDAVYRVGSYIGLVLVLIIFAWLTYNYAVSAR